MKTKWKKEKISTFAVRSKLPTKVEDSVLYKRLTIKLWGKGIILRDEVDGSKIGTKNQYVAKGGQFLLSRIDARNGAFGILPMELDGALISNSFQAYDIDKERVDIDFFNYFTKTENFLNFCVASSEGTTNRRNLDENKFLNYEVLLPPLPEQKRIVKKIKEIEEKVIKIQKERDIIFEPINFISGAYLDSIISKQQWPKEKLNKVAKINPSKSEVGNVDINTEVSFIPMSVVDDIDGVIKNPEIKKLKDVKKGYTYFAEGDVIFAKITPCMENGKSAIGKNLKNKIGFGSTEFHVVRPGKNILSEWIHLIFRNPSFRKEAEENMPGTAGQKRVPKEFLKEYKIPMPSIDIQKKVLSDMKNLQFKIDELGMEQSKSKLAVNALLPSILNKAFAGEL